MNKKVAFIGHRDLLPKDIEDRLIISIKNKINLGSNYFTMGTHGEFDYKALNICKKLRKIYNDIEIYVVITSLNQIKQNTQEDEYNKYRDVNTIMYDIEEQYFKRRIIESNKKMIDECDILICYVKPKTYKSGAKNIMNYAKRKGLEIINLYKKEDDFFDNMTKEEKEKAFKDFLKNNKKQ